MTPNSTSGLYYPSLTGLRAVAAWFIFIHHFPPTFMLGAGAMAFTQELHIGVSIFFTLSGFLITDRYLLSDGFSWHPYLRNRIAKVYPVYFLLTVLTFIFIDDSGWKVFLFNITLLRGFFEELKFTGVAQGWTLTVEECFYLLAPILFLLIRKFRGMYLLIPLVFLVVGAVFSFLPELPIAGYPLLRPFSFVLNYTIFGRVFEFLLGMGLALFLKKSSLSNSWKINWRTSLGLGIIAGVVGLLLMLQTETTSYGKEHPFGTFIHNTFLPMGTMLLLWGLIKEKTWLSRFLSTRFMWWMGVSSYSFYLIHMGIIHDGIFVFITKNWWLRVVLLQASAVALFIGFEYPVQQFIKGYDKGKTLLANMTNVFRQVLALFSAKSMN
ncbi:acyltransferase [Cytophagales bacterium LB-30]|uniref:Acyltransferase n=1 Tax=Shiella aurantiaca TaxID=3058365 RepID=A0ABT8F7G2_9BACT|nr:acyltransferase [Shiella aurantiaca]MDN4166417.1 acyltransferase [Shiella aurantiaca]